MTGKNENILKRIAEKCGNAQGMCESCLSRLRTYIIMRLAYFISVLNIGGKSCEERVSNCH